MKFGLYLLIALAVTVQSAPIDDASYVKETITAIHKAQEPLVEMKGLEKTEISKMKDAEKIEQNIAQIKSSEDAANALGKVEQDASQTVKMEDKQQELALTSLKVAKNTVEELSSNKLADPTIQKAERKALHKLEGVRNTLQMSTATSNTQKTAAKIEHEAKSLGDKLRPKKDLGETLDAAPELNPLHPQVNAQDSKKAKPAEGASSVLEQAAKKATEAKATEAKATEEKATGDSAKSTAAPEGAASSLQQALAKAKANENSAATKEEMTTQLKKMEMQEEKVIGAENTDIAEVTKLANDLN
jgi:hypothetical protein